MADKDDVAKLAEAAEEHFKQARYVKACNLYERAIELSPEKADLYFSLGEAFAKRERYKQAVPQYQEAIRRGYTPVHNAQYALGRAYLNLNQDDEALSEFQQAMDNAPKFSPAYDALGEVLEKKGELEAAIQKYSAAVQVDEGLTEGWFHWGKALAKKGEHKEALECFAKAFELDPAHQGLREEVGRLLIRLKLPVKAKAIKRWSEMAARVSRFEHHLAWGEILLDLDHAGAAFEQYLATLPMFEPPKDYDSWGSFFGGLQIAFDRLEEKAVALARVNQALESLNKPEARAAWARLLLNEGFFAEAAAQFEAALRADCVNDAIYQSLKPPRIFRKKRQEWAERLRIKELVARLEGILDSEQDPGRQAQARLKWAQVLNDWGLREKAKEELERALSVAPDEALRRQAHAHLGNMMERTGRDAEALPHWLEAFRLGGDYQTLFDLIDATWIDKIQDIVESRNDSIIRGAWASTLARIDRLDPARAQLEHSIPQEMSDTWLEAASGAIEKVGFQDPDLMARLIALVSQGKDVALHLRWGRILRELGRQRDAIDAFVHAGSLDPDKGDGWFEAGEIHRSLKEYDLAIDCFQRAAEAAPDSVYYYNEWLETLCDLEAKEGVASRLASALGGTRPSAAWQVDWEDIEAGRRRQANLVQHFVRTVKHNLDRPQADDYVFYGYRLMNSGWVEEALRLHYEASELDSNNFFAYIDCGVCCGRLGNWGQAMKYYERSIKIRPNEFLARMNLAYVYANVKPYEDAAGAFAEALDKGTDFSGYQDPREAKIQAYDGWANALSQTGDHEAALEKVRTALELKPDAYWLHFRRAYVLAEMGDFAQTEEAYGAAIRIPIDGDHPYAHHNLADLWNKQGLYLQAREKWEAVANLFRKGLAKAIENRDASYCMNYGSVLFDIFQDYQGAEMLLKAARLLDMNDPSIQFALASQYLEQKKKLVQKGGKSAEDLKTITGLSAQAANAQRNAVRILTPRAAISKNASTHNELGDVLLLMEDLDKANAAFAEALKLEDTSARACKGLGNVALRRKRYDEAIHFFRASLQRIPYQDLTVQGMLAEALLRSGALDEAEAEYQKILDVTGFNVDALIGLAEVYIDRADLRKDRDRDITIREGLYETAIERLSTAIDLVKSNSPNRPIIITANPASAYYLRGYAKVQIYETRRIRRDNRLLKEALRDFTECKKQDYGQQKAERAAKSIKEDSIKQPSIFERMVPPSLVIFAVILVVFAFFGKFIGFPNQKEHVMLTAQSFARLKAAGVGEKQLQALRSLQNIRFQRDEGLAAQAKDILEKKKLEPVNQEFILGASETRCGDHYVPITLSEFGLLIFGALIFIIGGASLPQLTSIKLPGGLQLDKSPSERMETVRSLGISK